MGDIRTKLIVEAVAKGFDEVKKQAASVNKSLSVAPSLNAGDSAFKRMAKSLRDWNSSLKQSHVNLKDMGKALTAVSGSATKVATVGFKAMSKGMADVRKQIQGAWETFKQFDKAQDTASRKRARKAKTVTSYAEEQDYNDLGGGGGGRGGKGKRGGKGGGGGAAEKQHGAFSQGLIEGILPGMRVIDRGPGALRQAAGITVGSTARNLASLPLTGGSISGALGSTFGSLAAPLQRLEDQAQRRIGFEREQVGMTPYMGGFGVTSTIHHGTQAGYRNMGLLPGQVEARAQQARRSAMSASPPAGAGGMFRFDAKGRMTPQGGAMLYRDFGRAAGVEMQAYEMQEAGIGRKMRELHGGDLDGLSRKDRRDLTGQAYRALGVTPGEVHQRYRDVAGGVSRSDAGNKAYADTVAAAERDRATVRRAAAAKSINPLMVAGRDFGGMNLQQSQQFAATAAQAGGGTVADLHKQGMLNNTFAAQTAFGVGPQTSGAFLQAGRIGGTAGGPGRAQGAKEFEGAIAQGLKLGLQGSELQDYMGQMASTITAWKQTGMPLARESIGAMGSVLQNVGGLAGARAGAGAQQAVSSLQQIGRHGAQSSLDVLAMRSFGGLKGPENYLDAAERMENLSAKDIEGGMPKYMRALVEGGGGSSAFGARTLQRGMEARGINLSTSEARLVAKRAMGEKLNAKEQSIADEQQGRITDAYKESMAKRDFGAVAKRATRGIAAHSVNQENQELMQGGAMIPAVNSMRDAANNTSKAFMGLAPLVNDLAKAIEGLVKLLQYVPGMNSGSDWRQGGGP